MIKNHNEYDRARQQIDGFTTQIAAMTDQLRRDGFDDESISLANAPVIAMKEDIEVDCALYDRLRTLGPRAVPAYEAERRGLTLVALRIACGLSQRELADRLGVSQAQVSRDERNDYHGITQERFARILMALNIEERGAYFTFRTPGRPIRSYLDDRRRMHEAGVTRAA